MTNNRNIFIVIPAYNESKSICRVLAPLVEQGYSVVVVDDGSKDDTYEQARQLPVYLLRHPINLGQGAALQTGMSFALKQNAQVIVHFDADGQHRVEDIPHLVAPIREGRVDVVLGSRFLRQEHIERVPISKRIVLRGGVFINAIFTGLWLTDAHNGFRAFSAEAARKIRLQENGFAHATEILVRIAQYQLRYEEVPTMILYTDYSKAKGQPISNSVNIVIDMLLHKFFR